MKTERNFYSCKNIKVLSKMQWILVVLLSFFVIRYFRVHAHLSKCWRGTWSEKGWELLLWNVLTKCQKCWKV